MKRRILKAGVRGLIGISCLLMMACCHKGSNNVPVDPGASAGQATTDPNKGHIVQVYYFHQEFRCPTCMTIEELTKQAVESFYQSELESGRVELLVLDMDLPENQKFKADFMLTNKSVIVCELRNGQRVRWKNLDRIWELYDQEADFLEYIKQEVGLFLNGPGANK